MFKALSLKCPSCFKSDIYRSYFNLKIKDSCESCGLDYTKFDVGDAAAYFSIVIIGILIPLLAITVEVIFSPPFWVHALLWVPATLIFCYVTLIYIRAIFIYLEYKVKKSDKNL